MTAIKGPVRPLSLSVSLSFSHTLLVPIFYVIVLMLQRKIIIKNIGTEVNCMKNVAAWMCSNGWLVGC